jgi:hypothetical protein
MAMGTVIKKTLADGETILVDGNSILCFESSVTVDVRPVGGIAAICCGGEGIFNTELTGALFLSFVFACVCLYAYVYAYVFCDHAVFGICGPLCSGWIVFLQLLVHLANSFFLPCSRIPQNEQTNQKRYFCNFNQSPGPGTIHLQSLSIDKLRLLFPPNVVSNDGGDGGGGGE